jgi:hypothetical protein
LDDGDGEKCGVSGVSEGCAAEVHGTASRCHTLPMVARSSSKLALLSLGCLVSLVISACGSSPGQRAESPGEEDPAVRYLAGCVDVVSCGRSLEEAKAFSASCGECEIGRNAVKSVRARFDSLYLEESRKAAGGR